MPLGLTPQQTLMGCQGLCLSAHSNSSLQSTSENGYPRLVIRCRHALPYELLHSGVVGDAIQGELLGALHDRGDWRRHAE